MPDAPSSAPSTTTSTSTPTRRLLSKLSSPFASRSRNITEFSIETDEPHKQHSPGDVVKGSVRLCIAKPTRVQHIVVRLHGYVQVYRNPGGSGEGYKANKENLGGTGRGKKSGEYFGNGFASLFEDEVVLCGDGRLGEGEYQFHFELDFPDRDLPSSIEFERGTICYMVTSTLTRPTTISPTMRCDRKVYFVERIDIGPLAAPQPRTITLEPISRRSKAKHQAKRLVDPAERRHRRGAEHSSESSAPGESTTSSGPGTDAQSQLPLSHSESQASMVSNGSIDSSAQGTNSASMSPTTESSENPKLSHNSLPARIITTTIASQTSGVLRGDNIHVTIHVSHTKHIKSLYGAIITFYRSARTDLHPAIPLGPAEKGTTAKYEDYYPKSLTGLGGLSLSGAGSSHVFRKDLSQTMLPLLVDPTTLTAEINAKVRVPEEVFPTIATVPGGMISFKYYVEVVLDVQGKLAGQDRQVNLGAVAQTPLVASAPDGIEGERSAFSAFGPQIADTSHIRRDKSVIACTFEMVVGTNDSARRKGKRKLDLLAMPPDGSDPNANIVGSERPMTSATNTQQGQEWDRLPHGYQARQTANGSATDDNDTPQPPRVPSYDRPPPEDALPPVPLPQRIPDERNMSEKERMRYREMQLLPSQPPGVDQRNGYAGYEGHEGFEGHEHYDGYGYEGYEGYDGYDEHQAHAGAYAPTAPYLPDDDGYHAQTQSQNPDHVEVEGMAGPSAPAYTRAPGLRTSHRDFHEDDEYFGAETLPLPPTPLYEATSGNASTGFIGRTSASGAEHLPLPPTPIYEANSATASGPSARGMLPPSDDKQELQRRMLAQEASAPPVDEAPYSPREQEPAPGPSAPPGMRDDGHGPSVPTFEEIEQHEGAHDSEVATGAGLTRLETGLPRYER